jgi:hypothetical protein
VGSRAGQLDADQDDHADRADRRSPILDTPSGWAHVGYADVTGEEWFDVVRNVRMDSQGRF